MAGINCIPGLTAKSGVQHELGCTGDQVHAEALKSKMAAVANLLGIIAQGALVQSPFMNASLMDVLSKFFLSAWTPGIARGRLSTACAQTMGLYSLKLLRSEGTPHNFFRDLFKSELLEDPEL